MDDPLCTSTSGPGSNTTRSSGSHSKDHFLHRGQSKLRIVLKLWPVLSLTSRGRQCSMSKSLLKQQWYYRNTFCFWTSTLPLGLFQLDNWSLMKSPIMNYPISNFSFVFKSLRYSKQTNWLASAENTDHRLVLLVIGISDRGVPKLVIRSHEFNTINQMFSFSRLDPWPFQTE